MEEQQTRGEKGAGIVTRRKKYLYLEEEQRGEMERAREDYFSLKNKILRLSTSHFDLWKVEKLPSALFCQRTVGVWTKALWIHFEQLTGTFPCRTVTYYCYCSSVSCNLKESTALWFCCQRLNVVSKQKPEQQHNCYIKVQINYLLYLSGVSKTKSAAQSQLWKW